MSATPFTIFMPVRTTNAWLALPPAERFGFLGSEIKPLLARYPTVKMRFFDAEGFNARVSDMIVWETADLDAYQAVIDDLRETRFWGAYFEIVEIVMGVENRYASHYGEAAV